MKLLRSLCFERGIIPLFINTQKPCRYKDVKDGKRRATIHTLGQALIGNRTETLKPAINH